MSLTECACDTCRNAYASEALRNSVKPTRVTAVLRSVTMRRVGLSAAELPICSTRPTRMGS